MSLNDTKIPKLWKKYSKNPQDFLDQSFQPLLKAYKKFHPGGFKYPSLSRKIPKFLLVAKRKLNSSYWKQQTKHITNNECALPCNVTDDLAEKDNVDAIVFFLKNVRNPKDAYQLFPKRNLSQPWIMLDFEAQQRAHSWYQAVPYRVFNGFFNRTMMFRLDSDVVVNHGFIVSKKDAKHLPQSWVLPSPGFSKRGGKRNKGMKEKILTKKLVVAFISNCDDRQSGRMSYIRELQRYITVDIYGACGPFKCGTRKYAEVGYNITKDMCYRMVQKTYLFYLSFENAICKDYATEKLYNILYYDIVPVVFGGADYKKILPENSYIDAMDYTPEELAAYLIFLQRNPDLYLEYLKWKLNNQVSTISGSRPLCHLCVRLHDSSFYKKTSVKNFDNWFIKKSGCLERWLSEDGDELNLHFGHFIPILLAAIILKFLYDFV